MTVPKEHGVVDMAQEGMSLSAIGHRINKQTKNRIASAAVTFNGNVTARGETFPIKISNMSWFEFTRHLADTYSDYEHDVLLNGYIEYDVGENYTRNISLTNHIRSKKGAGDVEHTIQKYEDGAVFIPDEKAPCFL
jgi:hypothetical protein